MRRWTVTFKLDADVEIAVTLNADNILKAIETASQYYGEANWMITDVTSHKL